MRSFRSSIAALGVTAILAATGVAFGQQDQRSSQNQRGNRNQNQQQQQSREYNSDSRSQSHWDDQDDQASGQAGNIQQAARLISKNGITLTDAIRAAEMKVGGHAIGARFILTSGQMSWDTDANQQNQAQQNQAQRQNQAQAQNQRQSGNQGQRAEATQSEQLLYEVFVVKSSDSAGQSNAQNQSANQGQNRSANQGQNQDQQLQLVLVDGKTGEVRSTRSAMVMNQSGMDRMGDESRGVDQYAQREQRSREHQQRSVDDEFDRQMSDRQANAQRNNRNRNQHASGNWNDDDNQRQDRDRNRDDDLYAQQNNNRRDNRMARSRMPRLVPLQQVLDTKVRNEQGQDLGELQDFAIDPASGRVRYAVLAHGGFVGIGEKLIAVPLQALQITGPDRVFMNATEQQIANAQGFSDDKWPLAASGQWNRSAVAQRNSRAANRDAEDDDYRLAGSTEDDTETDTGSRRVLKATDLLGMSVQNYNGDDLGDIDNVALDLNSQRVTYALMSYGGIWNMGDDVLGIPWDAMNYSPDENAMLVDLTERQLKEGPRVARRDRRQQFNPDYVVTVYKFYEVQPYWERSSDDMSNRSSRDRSSGMTGSDEDRERDPLKTGNNRDRGNRRNSASGGGK